MLAFGNHLATDFALLVDDYRSLQVGGHHLLLLRNGYDGEHQPVLVAVDPDFLQILNRNIELSSEEAPKPGCIENARLTDDSVSGEPTYVKG